MKMTLGFPKPELGGFRTYLDVREHPSGNSGWLLLAPLVYHGNEDAFVVPAGFVTDFASVPELLQSFVSPIGKQTKPAVLHDWLYWAQPPEVTRRDADALFRRAMKEMGVNLFRRNAAYAAVRIYGWVIWRKNRRSYSDAVQ